ncbi:Brefeldin A-inhibited guanine nucleotide-exchange protein 3 [Abeliophyllum distichum]|uniref:Brefeldin A-inhibited guanine nucleotide-exchange protein 3 n=1 Tax=Abeliophyllum distichum TaxID=126358 RepID=A0ABD1TFD0_9LAMI
MKTPPKDAVADAQSMKGKIVALELLKILLENAGAIFRTSERFLGAIKQYFPLNRHYNTNHIRLVWSKIWQVLSDYFVTIGCSENLSIAIFAMDFLLQLSMKFLEREELANYNFQNEFMKPFVIVMHKSSAVEIRELIIRCVSQMVLSRVKNIKSGWKGMFMVFTTAAYDDHKNIVLLAFEIIEKIVRDYFPYITETETTTFTDCVNCLIAFTNSRFNKDISLNAIEFLRFCAEKLAEGDLGSSRSKEKDTSGKMSQSSPQKGREKEFRINGGMEELDQDSWVYETCTLALQLVVDLFVNFYDTVNPLLKKVIILLVTFIKRLRQSLAGIGIAAFVRLMSNAGDLFSDDKWLEVVLSLKEVAEETLPDFSLIVNEDGEVRIHNEDLSRKSTDESARTITACR